jgi:hypothetical protein
MTPIRIQENMHLALDTITLVGAANKNEVQTGEAQLTLRNHEIFEDVEP